MDLSPLLLQKNRRIEPVVENPMVSFKLAITGVHRNIF